MGDWDHPPVGPVGSDPPGYDPVRRTIHVIPGCPPEHLKRLRDIEVAEGRDAAAAEWNRQNDHRDALWGAGLESAKYQGQAPPPNPGGAMAVPGVEKESSEDNWRNKSTFCCATCQWCVVKESGYASDVPLGRCRRHAPTLGGWPVVYATDWCGDHKLGRPPR